MMESSPPGAYRVSSVSPRSDRMRVWITVLVAAALTVGCAQDNSQDQSKRAQDRLSMQLSEAERMRDEYKTKLTDAESKQAIAQQQLAAAQSQLKQAQDDLARARLAQAQTQ